MQRFAILVFLLLSSFAYAQASDDFTLHPGDHVSITIEGIGTLENPIE